MFNQLILFENESVEENQSKILETVYFSTTIFLDLIA